MGSRGKFSINSYRYGSVSFRSGSLSLGEKIEDPDACLDGKLDPTLQRRCAQYSTYKVSGL
jgi:hypothetical protein